MSFLTGKYVGNAVSSKKYGVGDSKTTSKVLSSIALTPTSSMLPSPLLNASPPFK